MKIISLIWLLGILAFLVADVRTGASQDKGFSVSRVAWPNDNKTLYLSFNIRVSVKDGIRKCLLSREYVDKISYIQPLRCYICAHVDNTTDCHSPGDLSQVKCSPELPYCGTIAKSPDYRSSLACTSGSQTPCTLIQKAKDTYEMTCTCDGHLCNKPFTREFRSELLNFSSINLSGNTTSGLLEMFINSSIFANITLAGLYKAVTMTPIQEPTKLTLASPIPIDSSTVLPIVVNNENAPRAEALKHEATVPSDDDEDESEGSGSFEDVKPQAPAAPAAPSSFLPANKNAAISVYVNLPATILLISLYTVA